MSTSFMLKPNIKLNTLTNQSSMIQLSPIVPFAKYPNFPRLITNPKLTLKCSVTSKHLNTPSCKMFQRETRKNPNGIIFIHRGGRGETLVQCFKNNPFVWCATFSIKTFFVLFLVSFLAWCLDVFIQNLVKRPPTLRSVIKLQVGFLGSAKSIRKDFNLIAMKDAKYNLKESTIAILRRLDYCISGYSSVGLSLNKDNCIKQFNCHSIEEGGKLLEDTQSNSNNMKNGSTSSNESTEVNNEYIVVTLLVAAEGLHRMPAIYSLEDVKEVILKKKKKKKDVKEALKSLGSIAPNKIVNVELLLNPQSDNDRVTERDMLKNYSHLRLHK